MTDQIPKTGIRPSEAKRGGRIPEGAPPPPPSSAAMTDQLRPLSLQRLREYEARATAAKTAGEPVTVTPTEMDELLNSVPRAQPPYWTPANHEWPPDFTPTLFGVPVRVRPEDPDQAWLRPDPNPMPRFDLFPRLTRLLRRAGR